MHLPSSFGRPLVSLAADGGVGIVLGGIGRFGSDMMATGGLVMISADLTTTGSLITFLLGLLLP